MILDENLFNDANDIDLVESFNIIADGYAPNEYDKEWAIDDINNVRVDINDVVEYHVNEDADYFILTFKDGTKKAWYIHSGMYIPDKNFEESLKEDLAAYIQKLHDEDEYLWNLHDTDYTWLYDELDKYNNNWRDLDSSQPIADVIRTMPKEKQREIYDWLIEPYINESLEEDLTFNNKEVELIKKYLEKELGHTWTDRDDEKQIRLILNKIHNKDKALKEDFDEVVAIEVPDVNVEIEAEETKPEGPAPGADTGITDLLLSLINDENSTIQTYNSFKASLEDHADFDDVINDIVAEEYNHVGMLQTLLRKISPNSVTIDAGEEEAEDILTKEDNDSLEYGEVIGEIDDSFDNGFGGIFA